MRLRPGCAGKNPVCSGIMCVSSCKFAQRWTLVLHDSCTVHCLTSIHINANVCGNVIEKEITPEFANNKC